MNELRIRAAKLFRARYGIEEKTTQIMFEDGALKDHVVRDMLVKDDYEQLFRKVSKTELKEKIAEKYCISVKLVEYIVYPKT